MIRVLFVAMFAAILFRWAKNWRRVVGVTLIAAVSVGMVFPPPAYAQFGLLGGIQNILNIINGAIRSVLEYDWRRSPSRWRRCISRSSGQLSSSIGPGTPSHR